MDEEPRSAANDEGRDAPGAEQTAAPVLAQPADAEAARQQEVPGAEQRAMTPERLRATVEALLFVSKEPLTIRAVRHALSDEAEMTAAEVATLMEELRVGYLQEGRGFRLVELAGGYQLRTASEFAPTILKLLKEPREERLSQPALETLAIVAYRQPIVKAEIEGIRGVDVSAMLQKLLDRGLVRIAGRKEVPGRPFLYETTRLFLEHFGLKSFEELPHISELRAADPLQEKLDLK